MLNSRGQNCRQQVSSLDLSCFKLMKHGSGCGGGGSALHPLLVCREAPQAQQANEGLISLWTASRSRGWSPWHRHTEQDKQTRCPHYILYSCTVSRWGTVVQEVKSGQLSGTGVWRDVRVSENCCSGSWVEPQDRDSPVGTAGSNMEAKSIQQSCYLASTYGKNLFDFQVYFRIMWLHRARSRSVTS